MPAIGRSPLGASTNHGKRPSYVFTRIPDFSENP